MTLLALVAAATAVVAYSLLAYVAARRAAYPYDLEWMESGVLCHALRLIDPRGQGIYVPPSVDFIPFLYTPLYPGLLALLHRAGVAVGYLPARLLSSASFLLALASGAALVRRLSGSRLAALVALALPAAAFPLCGGFYDLARGDSLQLGLTALAALLAFSGSALPAGLLLCAAFFAKQTAAPLTAAIALALLAQRRFKALLILCAAGGLAGALGLWALNHSSQGWFWTYIFRLHQGHAFFTRRAFVETPQRLLLALGPALLLIPLALWRARSAGLYYACWLGLAGLFTAALSFGTQWAHVNAYIPGVFFPALAVGVAAGRLATSGPAALRALTWLCLSASLLLQLRTFRPAEHLPTPADRAAGDALIRKLREAPGEVLIPFHPFYGHLAGKRTYLHRMGVWDVRGTVAGPVRGLAEALRERRFARIVFDWKVEYTWQDWPAVQQHYRVVERFRGPRCVEGADTAPALLLEPLESP